MFASSALTVALAAQLGMAAPPPRSPAQVRRPLVVAGHLPSWRFPTVAPDRLKGLTDLMIFSIQTTSRGEIDFGDLDMAALKRYREAKTRVGYRLWITVGGWGRSGGFSSTVRSAESRKRLLDELSFFMSKEGFDGVTFDWQHPRTPQEMGDYSSFLSEAKKVLAARKRVLGLTVASWVELPSSAYRAADRVFVTSYDYPGQHSTITDAERDVARLRSRGATPSKIVLGVPFYGRSLENPSKTMGYGEILRQFAPAPSQDEAGGFSFNSPETIRRKADLTLDQGLAGIAIWEVGQDAPGDQSLLRALTIPSVEPMPGPRPDPRTRERPPFSTDPGRIATKNERGNWRTIRQAAARPRRASTPAPTAGSRTAGPAARGPIPRPEPTAIRRSQQTTLRGAASRSVAGRAPQRKTAVTQKAKVVPLPRKSPAPQKGGQKAKPPGIR